MKFARYLEDTQTPEWKKAYINYRGLKKRITAIRKYESDSESPSESPRVSTAPEVVRRLSEQSIPSNSGSRLLSTSAQGYGSAANGKPSLPRVQIPQAAAHVRIDGDDAEPGSPTSARSQQKSPNASPVRQRPPGIYRRTSIAISRLTLPRSLTQPTTPAVDAPPPHALIPRLPAGPALPLQTLLPLLPSVHLSFFEFLDQELAKVEAFYVAREKEARTRAAALKEQLRELKDHRRLFYEAHPQTSQNAWLPIPKAGLRARFFPPIPESPQSARPELNGKSKEEREERPYGIASGSGHGTSARRAGPILDPEDYQHAKKKLKRAVLEYYRGLEVLNNYRIMNLTGFRKALKKYEKVTKIPAQQAYTREKVEPSAFASGDEVSALIKEMEELFAARFERGDKKRAMARLRAGAYVKSHHFSTFRSGLLLGLGLPAAVAGVYQSFQQTTREAIPAWEGLLLVYAAFLIPTLFSLLVGLNVLVWSRSRINYVFIFELDTRSRLDPREYFEIPALLLATLAYAFYLSFARIGDNNVPPAVWPIAWLAIVVLVMFNPLPLFFKRSRFWLLRSVGKLLTSGAHHVEFSDFWMGDQFCSLVFTLSNLYYVGCVYSSPSFTSFNSTLPLSPAQPGWQNCSRPTNWGVPFTLASLPLLARLVQSIRRYVDSRLPTHLINGGKYGAGIVYYLFYYYWRHQSTLANSPGAERGPSFAFFCLFGTVYAIYACTWDFLMDWSFFQPRAKYPLLRREVVYTNHIPLYYFAIISNICIRFIWVIYIPQNGLSYTLKTFIAAMLEMLRRLQWNFYRLENEHLGNMDQYRVTREVPLPYQLDDPSHDNEDIEDRDVDALSLKSTWIGGRGRRASKADASVRSMDSGSGTRVDDREGRV